MVEIYEKLNDIIHDRLLTLQQKFVRYRQLSCNPQFHFNGKIFTECIEAIQEVINITRNLTNNDKEVRKDG